MTLTFQNLQDNGSIPANSFTVINNKLYLDIGVLVGESVTALSSTKVVETALKFLIACNKAQDIFNATALPGYRLNSFPQVVSGSNQYYATASTPGYYSTMQATVVGLVPANIDAVTDVMQ